MITALILMNVQPGAVKTLAEQLLAVDGIYEVYSVAGPFDLVAIARVKHHEELSDLVSDRVGALDGIETTETLIAFRTYAKKDPGLLWDVGA
jgi:DNA-binding Lrp family transcriptional regulator